MKNSKSLAINKAKNNLEELQNYFKFGLPTILETTSSGNVSFISIDASKPEGSGSYNNPMLNALKLEDKTMKFINDQLRYIQLLPEEHKKIIIYKYIKDITIHKLTTYPEFEYISKNKLYEMEDEAIEMIAVYDIKISYSINDFVMNHSKKKLKLD